MWIVFYLVYACVVCQVFANIMLYDLKAIMQNEIVRAGSYIGMHFILKVFYY
jgi:hypothetical protein